MAGERAFPDAPLLVYRKVMLECGHERYRVARDGRSLMHEERTCDLCPTRTAVRVIAESAPSPPMELPPGVRP